MVFKNRYYKTDEMMKEYINKVLCRKIFIRGGVITATSFGMLVITLMKAEYVFSAIFGVCLFVAVFTMFLTPGLTFRQMKDSDKRLHGGREEETAVTFGDSIKMQEGTFSLEIKYSQIMKTIELKNSYVLMFGKVNAVLVDPKGFTKGSFEEFKAFIAEKTRK